jgi:hypothetical protein
MDLSSTSLRTKRLILTAFAPPDAPDSYGATTPTLLYDMGPSTSAFEQEKLQREAAKRKREFIPNAHAEGTRAARLLDGIGSFCREKTFQPTAPYAPGVTGIRFSQTELAKIR